MDAAKAHLGRHIAGRLTLQIGIASACPAADARPHQAQQTGRGSGTKQPPARGLCAPWPTRHPAVAGQGLQLTDVGAAAPICGHRPFRQPCQAAGMSALAKRVPRAKGVKKHEWALLTDISHGLRRAGLALKEWEGQLSALGGAPSTTGRRQAPLVATSGGCWSGSRPGNACNQALPAYRAAGSPEGGWTGHARVVGQAGRPGGPAGGPRLRGCWAARHRRGGKPFTKGIDDCLAKSISQVAAAVHAMGVFSKDRMPACPE